MRCRSAESGDTQFEKQLNQVFHIAPIGSELWMEIKRGGRAFRFRLERRRSIGQDARMSKCERTLDGGTKIVEYELADGWIAQVGKTAIDNDELSIKHAGQRDWWFHVRRMPGGHVVLRARDDVDADKSVLKEAAAIAAYHSKSRDAGQVAVSCTLAKNVSKPRGAKPGTVAIKKEKVLKVRPGIPG